MLSAFAAIWRHRALLRRTAWSDLRSRFAGSAFGIAWLFLYPLLLLGAYATVQGTLREPPAGMTSAEFVLLVFCGLIPFLGFAEALSLGTTAVTGATSLIKNTLFPIEMVPVKAVLVSQASQAVGTAILLVGLAVLGKLSVFCLLFPIVWALQVVFTLGVVWILASANVFVRDLQQIVGLVTLVLMLISPIGFTADGPTADSMRWLLTINPLSYVMGPVQDTLLLGRYPVLHNLEILAVLAFATFAVGHWVFLRLKRVMTDNV